MNDSLNAVKMAWSLRASWCGFEPWN